jgi:hypothetical protein
VARLWLDKLTRWAMRDLSGAEEVAATARRLAAWSPRQEHHLTTVLIRLAALRAEADRRDDALASLAEAVEICRRRAVGEPARFEPNLAAALHRQSLLHAELDQHEHALSAAEQAVELYQRLLPRAPGWVEPLYANALGQLGFCLSDCDRLEEAVPVVEHAVRIERRLAADSPGEYESALADSLHNRELCLTAWTQHVAEQAAPDEVVLGPHPLCDACKQVSGGLVAVRHRQVHVRAHGKESCVDQGLAEIVTGLWAVCATRSCCEDEGGRAYVVPEVGQAPAAEEFLTGLGIRVENEGGFLCFTLPGR